MEITKAIRRHEQRPLGAASTSPKNSTSSASRVLCCSIIPICIACPRKIPGKTGPVACACYGMLIADGYNWTLWHTVLWLHLLSNHNNHNMAYTGIMVMFFHGFLDPYPGRSWSVGVSGTAICPPRWREALGLLQYVEESKLQVLYRVSWAKQKALGTQVMTFDISLSNPLWSTALGMSLLIHI